MLVTAYFLFLSYPPFYFIYGTFVSLTLNILEPELNKYVYQYVTK